MMISIFYSNSGHLHCSEEDRCGLHAAHDTDLPDTRQVSVASGKGLVQPWDFMEYEWLVGLIWFNMV